MRWGAWPARMRENSGDLARCRRAASSRPSGASAQLVHIRLERTLCQPSPPNTQKALRDGKRGSLSIALAPSISSRRRASSSRLTALRRLYDPKTASICRAHISLSEPLQAPLTNEQLREIRTALSAVQPYDIQYGPLRSFPPHPGVCYSIAPEAEFRRLRAVLHATSAFAGIPRHHELIAPHMTIAEFISLERTAELLQQLSGKVPEGTFRCDSVGIRRSE